MENDCLALAIVSFPPALHDGDNDYCKKTGSLYSILQFENFMGLAIIIGLRAIILCPTHAHVNNNLFTN